jgi:hypothetical protein
MVVLQIVNIIVITINIFLLLYLVLKLRKIEITYKIRFETIESSFGTRITELSDAVKYLTKLNLKKLNKEDKPKVVPFKIEDADKIKEILNASNST